MIQMQQRVCHFRWFQCNCSFLIFFDICIFIIHILNIISYFLLLFFDMLTYTLLQIIGPPESPSQTPPSFLVNLVHIMWWKLKVEPQIFSHSLLNCVFFVASFRTFEGRKSPPVRPQPTTWHLTLAGVFPFFLGSLMIFTNLVSVAFFF